MKPLRKYSYDDLSRPGAEDPIRYAARYLRDNFICGNMGTPLSQGNNSPLSWLRKSVQSGLGCPPSDSDPPNSGYPTPQGKCPILYNIAVESTYELKVQSTGQWEPRNESATVAIGILGPITNIRYETVGGRRYYIGTARWNGANSSPSERNITSVVDNEPDVHRNAQSQLLIVPSDPNQTDSCSDPVPTYPPTPRRDDPAAPPKWQIPPVIIIPVSPTLSIPVSVKVNVSVNANINFRIADSIDIQFGPRDVDIYINPSANIDIFPDAPSPGYELPDGYPDEPTGNDGNDGGGEPGDCAKAEDLENVQDLLAEIQAQLNIIQGCSCDSPVGTPIILGNVSGNNGNVVLPTGTKIVAVTLAEKPQNPKIEWGGGAAPDVYYAGWTSFVTGEFAGKRDPIDYEKKVFAVPSLANRFSWTCRRQYSALVQFYGYQAD